METKRTPRLFITGDTHRDLDINKLSTKKWKEQKVLTRDDILLVAGDFGLPWTLGEDATDRLLLAWYEEKPFTTIFVDGNHDNEDAIRTYPEITYLGAKCHQIRENVLHAERGEVLHIGEHKVLCMGGAMSVDIERRTPHISWWRDEEGSFLEWAHCQQSLITEKPDIIVSHDAPESVVEAMFPEYTWIAPTSSTQKNFEIILREIKDGAPSVKDWYFGHHHKDREVEIDGIMYHGMYQKIEEIL